MDLYLSIGGKWSQMCNYFPLRTADMIKNRFHSSIKKKMISYLNKTNNNVSPVEQSTIDSPKENKTISYAYEGYSQDKGDYKLFPHLHSQSTITSHSFSYEARDEPKPTFDFDNSTESYDICWDFDNVKQEDDRGFFN